MGRAQGKRAGDGTRTAPRRAGALSLDLDLGGPASGGVAKRARGGGSARGTDGMTLQVRCKS